MKRLALALAATALLVPAPAQAATDWLPIFTTASITYWGHGQLPACGQPQFAWGETPPGSGAMANADTCLVTFAKQYWYILSGTVPAMCALTVHEIGHLYGHQHAEGGVMASDGLAWISWRSYPPCAQTIQTRQVCKRTGTRADGTTECHYTYRPRVH